MIRIGLGRSLCEEYDFLNLVMSRCRNRGCSVGMGVGKGLHEPGDTPWFVFGAPSDVTVDLSTFSDAVSSAPYEYDTPPHEPVAVGDNDPVTSLTPHECAIPPHDPVTLSLVLATETVPAAPAIENSDPV